MIINLGYGWAVAGKYFLAFFICLKDRFICFRLVFFQPGKERGAKVVADFRIGINISPQSKKGPRDAHSLNNKRQKLIFIFRKLNEKGIKNTG